MDMCYEYMNEEVISYEMVSEECNEMFHGG